MGGVSSSTHTAAGRHGDLDGVPAGLTHILEVQWFVRGLVVAPLYHQRRGVHADRHRRRPVGVHLTVLVVETLELQLEVRPGDKQCTV